MKKSLVLGAMLVASVFLFTGAALTAEYSTSGTIQFKLTGTSQEDQASGLFAAGDVDVSYAVTLTSGSWEVNITPKYNQDDDLAFDAAYVKVTADMMSLSMKPMGGERLQIWDIRGNSDTKIRLPSDPGIDLGVPIDPLSLTLAVTNRAVDDEAKFNFGVGATYALDPITVEAIFATSDVAAADFYGSYYGAKVTYAADPLTIEGQFGTFSPEAAALEEGSGYFGKFAYAMGEGLGTFTVKYTAADENLNRTAEEWSKIVGEYSHPLTDDVTFTLELTNITPGTGADSYTNYAGIIKVSV